MTNIGAIILAAGNGSRIGQPKWQLLYKNSTFLNIIIDKLLQLNLSEIVCVVSKESVPADDRINVVINPTPEKEMLSSIYCGIQALKNVDGYLIVPVDHPFVSTKTLNALCEDFISHREKVIRPVYKKRGGHPIIISNAIAKQITNSDYAGGLKQFLIAKNAIIRNIKVNDDGILRNVNTKEDL